MQKNIVSKGYEKMAENKKLITADNSFLTYMGRIDFSEKTRPEFYYAGSNVKMTFTGTSVSAVIKNHKYFNIQELGFVMDGKEGKVTFDKNDEDITFDIACDLEKGTHTVTLFKRQDASHYFEFVGFEIDPDGEVLENPPLPARKIECYGDSVSAGAVCEAVDFVASCDPEDHQGVYDNAWHSYAMITARNLGAQIHNIAQGCIAIFDNTGYYHAPNYIGMESVYNKLCYFPEGAKGVTPWDFENYTPDVVLFAVGQNDPHNEGHEDFDIADPDYRAKWKNAYKSIILDLRSKYPNATFVLLLTVLCHGEEWDKAVDEIANELNDEKITHFMFTRTGKATPGHPRLPEQYEMAEELTAYLSNMGDKIWG